MRHALRSLSTVLIVAGALLLADAATTLLWQEPLSALYGRIQQGKLEDRLSALEKAPLAAVDQRALRQLDASRRLAFAARALARRSDDGAPLGRIRMPSIGVAAVFVAGHRTTYGAPFHDVDDLRRGDRIELDMPYGRFTYRVERTRIEPPTATEVTDRVGYDRLVLSACHPRYSAAKRIVVFARLTAAEPRGAALV